VKVLGVIPARYGAQRFPGKPLAPIAGKSLVERVWRQVSTCTLLDAFIVATEDQRIVSHVESFGGQAVMTSPDHASGTDRLGEVARGMSYDYYVNIQGDEPLVDPQAVDALIAATTAGDSAMSTLVTTLSHDCDDLDNPNVVKVVTNHLGEAMYFSRSVIPHPRNEVGAQYLKHIGIYVYSRETLAQICAWSPTLIERTESLEQLRALYNGVRILTVNCEYDPIAVDVPEDIDRVEARLAALGAA
jgi:3-deoxy-manno-octulosonate cytidylyltransferase (CMP-KDO synthetase)